MKVYHFKWVLSLFVLNISCSNEPQILVDSTNFIQVNRKQYQDQLEGFWLGQNIANWTGLVTEMDKIGNIGEFQTGNFYTREDWGKPDQPSIWSQGMPSDLSPTIDFVYEDEKGVWGSDDDTDIEYMYQQVLWESGSTKLTAKQIRDAWLKHIKAEEENYLWVSNQRAFDLMQEGMLPPATSMPENNEEYEMIDAQLTTEIFGLFAPKNPKVALAMAELPIRAVAYGPSADIARFYVQMYALAEYAPDKMRRDSILTNAAVYAANSLTEKGYPKAMFDYVYSKYQQGFTWEETRDSVYVRYQVDQKDGYEMTAQNRYCNGCFAAGINFASSLISLFWGEGNYKETIKIGVLCGWDADNPTATWGGLIGFMMGKKAIEKDFDQVFSDQYNIHRTRQNFPNNGLDTFSNMAKKGIDIIDNVVIKEIKGQITADSLYWLLPSSK